MDKSLAALHIPLGEIKLGQWVPLICPLHSYHSYHPHRCDPYYNAHLSHDSSSLASFIYLSHVLGESCKSWMDRAKVERIDSFSSRTICPHSHPVHITVSHHTCTYSWHTMLIYRIGVDMSHQPTLTGGWYQTPSPKTPVESWNQFQQLWHSRNNQLHAGREVSPLILPLFLFLSCFIAYNIQHILVRDATTTCWLLVGAAAQRCLPDCVVRYCMEDSVSLL